MLTFAGNSNLGSAMEMQNASPRNAKSVMTMLLAEIGFLLRKHSRKVEQIARRNLHMNCYAPVHVLLETQTIRVIVRDRYGAQTIVQLRVPPDLPADPVEVSVSCDCADDDLDFCEHTWMALAVLQEKVEAGDRQTVSSLVDLLTPKDWRFLFDGLDSILNRPRPGVDPQFPEFRLTWRLGWNADRQSVTLAPFEQQRTGSGEWSKGRRLSLYDLSPQSMRLTPADIAVAGVMRSGGRHYGRREMELNRDEVVPILSLLVDHPLVFWAGAPRREARIRSGRIGLAIVETEAGMKVRTAIDGRPCESGLPCFSDVSMGFVLIDPTRHEAIVCAASPVAIEAIRHATRHPIVVPPDATSAMLESLTRLDPHLPVTLPESMPSEERAAETTLVLQLSPQEPAGLVAELKFRPGEGFEPQTIGQGPERLAKLSDGKRLVLRRDFAAETAKAKELVGDLGLPEASLPAGSWRIEGSEPALDFIAKLRERPADDPVVEWPKGEKRSVVGQLSASALRVEIAGQNDWFDLKGAFQVGGQDWSLEQLLDLIRSGSRYIQVGDGMWAEIEKNLRDRMAALDFVADREAGGLRLGRTALPILEDLEQSEIHVAACEEWTSLRQRLRSIDETVFAPPAGLKAELRHYQLDGYRWLKRLALWGVGACLADDMGLGKTIQTLALLIDRAETGPALIVAPTSVSLNWVKEIERFAPGLRPLLYRESERSKMLRNLKPGDLLIVSYALLRHDAEKLLKKKWGTLVLDEAQAIKNSQTKTAQVACRLKAEWRLALTGTPIENHLGELWSLFRAISPGFLGSWERFKGAFADPIERLGDKTRQATLAKLIRPFVLRRHKSEVLAELPAKTEVQRIAEHSPAERRFYEAIRAKALIDVTANPTGEDQRFKILAALTRLRQAACHPGLIDGGWKKSSAKLDLLLELLDEIRDEGHRTLVFSQFVQHLALIREVLDDRKITYQYLDGQTPAGKRQQIVDAFQAGEGDLFLISLKAGGTGLNLTAADHVVLMDPWWNPAVEDQAADRAHRIGQTRPVVIHRLVAKDTIEEKILALHERKRDLIAGVLDGADQAAKMSVDELIALIRDDSPADSAPAPAARKRGGVAKLAATAPEST